LFGQPERCFQSAELIRLAGAGTGAVHRLLTRLATTGLLRVETVGHQTSVRRPPLAIRYRELVDVDRTSRPEL
jgi:DNA-binding IclR family transcriptional regulator